MNHWYQLRRMRGGAFLILIGVLALLNQWHILSWDKSWPFFLIIPGLLVIAERAAWSVDARAQREAQLDASLTGSGTVPSNAAVSTSWSTAPVPSAGESSFVQPHPSAPDDPGREER